jgi:ubiquinone/menaquinone biosynthesis C-methylase UbiE
MMDEIESFWKFKHEIDDKPALSGCFYDETVDFLNLNAYINPGAAVLEVGVGLGYVTKGLYEAGMKVSALDITDVALERVKDYCENIYNVINMDELPSNYFDVIICNNVVQHVPTNDLINELRELMRCLKINGVFAVEFVSNDVEEDMGINPTISEIQNGGLCRTPEYLENIFKKLGGFCCLEFDKKVDIGIVKGHHVFHVRRITI